MQQTRISRADRQDHVTVFMSKSNGARQTTESTAWADEDTQLKNEVKIDRCIKQGRVHLVNSCVASKSTAIVSSV